MKTPRKEALQSGALSVFILVMVLLVWHLATLRPAVVAGPAVTLTPRGPAADDAALRDHAFTAWAERVKTILNNPETCHHA